MQPHPIEPDPAKPTASEVITAEGRQQTFLLYTLFCGDLVKTAHSAGLTPATVGLMAEEGEWDEKISPILALRKSDKPGDLERAINRAINYVQAHRYRKQLERVIQYVTNISEGELRELLVNNLKDKAGNVHKSLSCRAFADLSSALEKAHTLSYLALNDTSSDRARRKEEMDGGVMAATQMHQQIAQAMQDVAVASPKGALIEAQAELAEEIRVQETSPDAEPEKPDEPLTPNIPPLPSPPKKRGPGDCPD
jgi:hypothetical protein